jgi:hypothetical protein
MVLRVQNHDLARDAGSHLRVEHLGAHPRRRQRLWIDVLGRVGVGVIGEQLPAAAAAGRRGIFPFGGSTTRLFRTRAMPFCSR